MSSSIPVISDVLFYTQSDSYNYLTDNRPVFQLDSNIRKVASSVVGIGYGEHQTISGGLLSVGKIVELLPNGVIKYPDSTSIPSLAILGLVTGSTGAGVNTVIWSSQLLDLDALGLAAIISGATPGQYICSDTNITGNLIIKSSISSSDLVLGTVRNVPYISIGKESQTSTVSDQAPALNHANNFSITRFRNLELLDAVNATPIQFIKSTAHQADIPLATNPLNISLNLSNGQISSLPLTSVTYGLDSNNWVLRESFNQFLTNEPTPNEDISYSSSRNTWSASTYAAPILGSNVNYELQVIGPGLDFTQPSNLPIFKQFNIVKYYQYVKVGVGDPLYGKISAIVTVFDPKTAQIGGEQTITMVCEFITYQNALESTRQRVVVTGNTASLLYNDSTIFPASIKI
jgi:hypothetical protein